MPKSNADVFPAHGNHDGKIAGVKIDLTCDLLGGSVVTHHLQAIVLAETIAHQLGMKIAQWIGSMVGRGRLSDEKWYDLLAVSLIKARTLAEVAAFDHDPRHVERDK